MAIPRITDNEMRYFQFKAKQLFLLQKEDYEWEEFCKKSATSNSSSSAEKCDKKTVKDVGIQAASKTLNLGQKVVPVRNNQLKEPLPEALNFIKAKLERIDLALSEIKTVSTENEKGTKTDQRIPETSRTFSTNWSSPSGSRKQLIQESLRQSLQRLQSSAVWKPQPNPSANIKLKNSGYMIPHDLQKQRIAARKAYLASLPKAQEKPNLNPDVPRKKTMQVKACQRKGGPNIKTAQKTKKKKTVKHKKAATTEPTLVAAGTSAEVKDENIETAVDNILDDLVGETVVVLNSINQKKEKKLNFLGITPNKTETESETVPKTPNIQLHWSKKTWSKHVSDEDRTVKQNFIHKAVETDKIQSNEKRTSKNMTSTCHQQADCGGDTSHLLDNRTSEESPDSKKISHVSQHQLSTESSKPSLYTEKWKVLSIGPRVSEEIIYNRNRYWDYLERISRVEKGNFNPWILSNTIAEVILDECIQDISQELGDMSSSVITALYNQEFLKSV